MAFTKLTKDMNIIQKLDDEPNDVGGLTAAELKAKFDEPANAVKDWINNTFIPEAEETLRLAQRESVPAHASCHASGGDDPITPGMIGAVNKAGDTMTGNLAVSKATPLISLKNTTDGSETVVNYADNTLQIQNRNASGATTNLRQLLLRNSAKDSTIKTALLLQDIVGGTPSVYTILHTGNKPSGSYTGNGGATTRQIDTGGIGSVIAIWGRNRFCIVGRYGAIVVNNGTVSGISHVSGCYFLDGILTVETANDAVNYNGSTFNYQVL